jgi:hypothetical protein
LTPSGALSHCGWVIGCSGVVSCPTPELHHRWEEKQRLQAEGMKQLGVVETVGPKQDSPPAPDTQTSSQTRTQSIYISSLSELPKPWTYTGCGRTSTVYTARHLPTGCLVAIKEVPARSPGNTV